MVPGAVPGKPRTLHLADTRVCRFHFYDKPTMRSHEFQWKIPSGVFWGAT